MEGGVFMNFLRSHYEKKASKVEDIVAKKRENFNTHLKTIAHALLDKDQKLLMSTIEQLLDYLDKEEYLDELNLKSTDVDALKMIYMFCCVFCDDLPKSHKYLPLLIVGDSPLLPFFTNFQTKQEEIMKAEVSIGVDADHKKDSKQSSEEEASHAACTAPNSIEKCVQTEESTSCTPY